MNVLPLLLRFFRSVLIVLFLFAFFLYFSLQDLSGNSGGVFAQNRDGYGFRLPNYTPGGRRNFVPPVASGPCAGKVDAFYDDNPFSGWPLDFRACDWTTISATYCSSKYEESFGASHHGIDITSARDIEGGYYPVVGQPIISTADFARVSIAMSDDPSTNPYNGGYGNYVLLVALDKICFSDPNQGNVCKYTCEDWDGIDYNGDGQITDYCGEELPWKAIYAHMQSAAVQTGQVVERGTVIGYVGNTGNSTGPHLHYQVSGPHGAIDPAPTFGCEGYNRTNFE